VINFGENPNLGLVTVRRKNPKFIRDSIYHKNLNKRITQTSFFFLLQVLGILSEPILDPHSSSHKLLNIFLSHQKLKIFQQKLF
jgi:hypothetical protein